jgi:Pyrimidine dimer DNA glycosylase
MNLFILSLSPKECAEMMIDKHIVKIILEAVQMLCTAKHVLEPENPDNKVLYKMAHKNHPVTIWVRTSYENFMWTLDLVEEMHREWRYRYDHPDTKFHKCYALAKYLRENPPKEFPQKGLTTFARAMPDEYKTECPVQSYRNYYMSEEKKRLASWKKRERPNWYV